MAEKWPLDLVEEFTKNLSRHDFALANKSASMVMQKNAALGGLMLRLVNTEKNYCSFFETYKWPSLLSGGILKVYTGVRQTIKKLLEEIKIALIEQRNGSAEYEPNNPEYVNLDESADDKLSQQSGSWVLGNREDVYKSKQPVVESERLRIESLKVAEKYLQFLNSYICIRIELLQVYSELSLTRSHNKLDTTMEKLNNITEILAGAYRNKCWMQLWKILSAEVILLCKLLKLNKNITELDYYHSVVGLIEIKEVLENWKSEMNIDMKKKEKYDHADYGAKQHLIRDETAIRNNTGDFKRYSGINSAGYSEIKGSKIGEWLKSSVQSLWKRDEIEASDGGLKTKTLSKESQLFPFLENWFECLRVKAMIYFEGNLLAYQSSLEAYDEGMVLQVNGRYGEQERISNLSYNQGLYRLWHSIPLENNYLHMLKRAFEALDAICIALLYEPGEDKLFYPSGNNLFDAKYKKSPFKVAGCAVLSYFCDYFLQDIGDSGKMKYGRIHQHTEPQESSTGFSGGNMSDTEHGVEWFRQSYLPDILGAMLENQQDLDGEAGVIVNSMLEEQPLGLPNVEPNTLQNPPLLPKQNTAGLRQTNHEISHSYYNIYSQKEDLRMNTGYAVEQKVHTQDPDSTLLTYDARINKTKSGSNLATQKNTHLSGILDAPSKVVDKGKYGAETRSPKLIVSHDKGTSEPMLREVSTSSNLVKKTFENYLRKVSKSGINPDETKVPLRPHTQRSATPDLLPNSVDKNISTPKQSAKGSPYTPLVVSKNSDDLVYLMSRVDYPCFTLVAVAKKNFYENERTFSSISSRKTNLNILGKGAFGKAHHYDRYPHHSHSNSSPSSRKSSLGFFGQGSDTHSVSSPREESGIYQNTQQWIDLVNLVRGINFWAFNKE